MSKDDVYRQYKLAHGSTEMVCWLKTDKPIRKTQLVTLKAIPDRIWVVREAYKTELPHPPASDWEVGGLKNRRVP